MTFSMIPIIDRVTAAFTTPILMASLDGVEDLNGALAQLIRGKEQENPGRELSNEGGWQSGIDLLEWPGPEIEALHGIIDEAIRSVCVLSTGETDPSEAEVDWKAQAWANINRNGDYNRRHSHTGAHWSLVYYVERGKEIGGTKRNGVLELFDPRPITEADKRMKSYGFSGAIAVDPSPGNVVVFPGWLEHMVNPFFGEGERISIAVNVMITGGKHAGLG